MKTGICIRVGSFDRDLSEATTDELDEWLKLLDREDLLRIVHQLVYKMQEVPEFRGG